MNALNSTGFLLWRDLLFLIDWKQIYKFYLMIKPDKVKSRNENKCLDCIIQSLINSN